MTFKVGDVCVIVGAPTCAGDFNPLGMECVVIGDRRRYENCTHPEYWVIGYEVRVSSGETFAVREQYLRKIDPPSNYDGNTKTQWNDLSWRPKQAKETAT